ncbi:MAG: 3-deoxy-7-phosphoheptulonate synthase [archaeon]
MEEKQTQEKLNDRNVDRYGEPVIPSVLKAEIPLSEASKRTVMGARQEIRDILDGKDRRKIVISGPCSVHDLEACVEFAERFLKLKKEVSSELLLIQRAYFEKPRTTVGWKGLIYDPDIDGSYQLAKGLKIAREYLNRVTSMGMPCATEFLGVITPQYIGEMISWAAIGARSTENQDHRRMASGLSMPVGFKNGTSGDIGIAIDAVAAARAKDMFVGINENGQACPVYTGGNRYGHVVLRGGNGKPNCHPETINKTLELLTSKGLPRNLIVDCSHGNSEKNHYKQKEVAYMILEQMLTGTDGIVGIMLEAHLNEGKQNEPTNRKELDNLKYGVSITDSCIDWQTNEDIIREYARRLRK